MCCKYSQQIITYLHWKPIVKCILCIFAVFTFSESSLAQTALSRKIAAELPDAVKFKNTQIYSSFTQIKEDYVRRINNLVDEKKSCLKSFSEKECCQKSYEYFKMLVDSDSNILTEYGNHKVQNLQNKSQREFLFKKNIFLDITEQLVERLQNVCSWSDVPADSGNLKRVLQKMTLSERQIKFNAIRKQFQTAEYKENKDSEFEDVDGVKKTQKVNNDYDEEAGQLAFEIFKLF